MTRRRLLAYWLSAFLAVTSIAVAEVKLPAVISDHMVLQRQMAVPIWGWADPGEQITVQMAGQTVQGAAGQDGKWMVKLSPLEAGGPYKMVIRGQSGAVTLKDILVGEVWVASGQSNMQFPVSRANHAEQEIAAADHPKLRLFTAPRKTARKPQKDLLSGTWEPCTPQSVGSFSAVAYFFGRDLLKDLDIPVGLIHTSWGGTRAEAWTSFEALASEPMAAPILAEDEKVEMRASRQFDRYEQEFAAWRKKAREAEAAGKPIADPPKPPDDIRNSQHRPSVLYNAMIAPLIPYAIRGAIWYQGESNAGRAYQYRALFPLMIRDWRQHWGEGDFPFLFVQLANFRGQPPTEPVESDWAELREAQLMTLSLPHTGMAVTIDIGEADDIHPTNKQDVGKRLALAARAEVYGEKITYSGPIYRSMKTEGSKIRLSFDHVDGGLISQDGKPLTGFAIAGKDHHFGWGKAVIDGDTVVVSSDQVAKPVAVRYAWASNPACNLANKEKLPASPFRTDDWPGVTIDKR